MVRRNKAAAFAATSIVAALAIGLGLAMGALMRERDAKQRELTAQQRELAQSVRADNVTTLIDGLLSDAVPVMVRQGNIRGVRELLDTVDRLATSSLSNATVAEINLRVKLRDILGNLLLDFPAALKQAETITRLLPEVSDDQLSQPREELQLETCG